MYYGIYIFMLVNMLIFSEFLISPIPGGKISTYDEN